MTHHGLIKSENIDTKATESAAADESSDDSCFSELADLCNLPDYIDIPTITTTTSTPTYDLNLEDLPTFDFNDLNLSNFDFSTIDFSNLSNIELYELDLELDLSRIDATSTLQVTPATPIYEPTPLPEIETFKHKCGYCGEPAGWQHNTRHFIRLRSGSRYACFSCLCQRWRGQCLLHQTPGLGIRIGSPLNPKTRHRRLPRRRIFEQQQRERQPQPHPQPAS